MSEFTGGNSKSINVDEHIVFENNTDSDFEVSAGIVFHKSGIYDVSIGEKRISVSKVAKSNHDLPSAQPERMKLVQKAVDTIMNTARSNSVKDKCFRNAARLVQNAIDGEPQDFELIPDEPERKTGGWIKASDADGDYYICSECGEELPRYTKEPANWDHPYPHKYSIDKTDFCPNCGSYNGEKKNG